MTQENKKSRLAVTITVLVALVIGGYLIANWSEFKAGLAGEPAPGRKTVP